MTVSRLVDERSSPPLRQRIGGLLRTADTVDLALGRVRLASLDLTEEEVRGPRQCRVLLGQLDAFTLLDAADPGPHAEALARLGGWLASDRLEVRSAGIAAWTPDFSIYRQTGQSVRCLIGAHYFGSPQLTMGPSLTVLLSDPAAAALLEARFDELWSRAHDVAPAIADVLHRAALPR